MKYISKSSLEAIEEMSKALQEAHKLSKMKGGNEVSVYKFDIGEMIRKANEQNLEEERTWLIENLKKKNAKFDDTASIDELRKLWELLQ